jgi:hypothetical protein
VDLTVSRPIKILVLILVIAGVAGVASMSMLGKSSNAGAPSDQLSVAQVRARAHKQATPTPAVKAPAVKAPAVKHTSTPAATTAAPAVATPTPKPTPKPRPTTAANGLPIALADALRRNRIVIVSIFDPQSQTDSVSYAEARAGAADAGVGFLGVSVLDDAVAGPLTAALPGGGLLPVPGLLFYRRPGVLVQRLDGFSDRDAVAQVALAARTAPPVTATPAAAVAAPVAPAPVATTPTTTTTP